MQLTDDTPVKIVSSDDRPFETVIRPPGPYGKPVVYKIEPGETVYWTWRVAKHFLGDPSKRNQPGLDEGDQEKERIHNSFGRLFDHQTYVQPNIQVFDMSGERILMAIEVDESKVEFGQSISSGDLQQRIAQMQAEIELLRQNASEQLPEIVTESTPDSPDIAASLDDIPDDGSMNPGPRRSGETRTEPLRASDTLTAQLPDDI
jgi:hypothetical protein